MAGQIRPAATKVALLPAHVLLAAAYPVIFLFAANAADQVTLDPLWAPLLLAMAGAATAFLLLLALRRDALNAGLMATVLVASFFGFGHVWNTLGGLLGNRLWLAIPWLLLTAVGVVVAWRVARPRAAGATRALNLVTALLVGISGAGIATTYLGQRVSIDLSGGGASVVTASDETGELPDVYYLIFDRYGRGDMLQKFFRYDNGPFLAELEERGFYVADETWANYSKTPLSLVSSLSMEYLDDEQLREEARDGEDREPIHRRLRGSLPVPASLKELGYTYHHVANWWEPTASNADADHVYRDDGPTEFATVLLDTTLVSALWQAEQIDRFDWRVYRSHHEYEVALLQSIATRPGPKYVFAHLLLPHEPYVFDRDGSFISEARAAELGERESYRRQLEYLNTQILEIVDHILADSDREAVIILQADEGPFPPRYRANDYWFDWRNATDDELEEKWGILNAYHLPGVEPEEAGLYPSITPVNSFRVVFNTYFGTDLPLIPDRMYAHVSQAQFFNFFEITDRLVR